VTRASEPRIAPTAAKALRVIELLAVDPSSSLSLAEMQRRLGYSHGNLHAICTTLVAMGHLRRESGGRAYRLGPSLLAVGDAARAAFPTVETALPFLETLAAEFDAEAHAAMRSGDTLVVVARVGTRAHEYGVLVGQRFPLTPPVGSTFVAWASAHDQEDYLASAAGVLTPSEIDRCRIGLASAVRRGYSIHLQVEPSLRVRDAVDRIREEAAPVERDDELRALVHELGHHDYMAVELDEIRSGTHVQVSSPAFDERGAVELSVGMSLRTGFHSADAVRAAGDRVVATARMITRAVGGRTPEH
jgi:DNA-binding IclR family transcriptional regulator